MYDVLAFLSGFIFLVLELLASRILAPSVGTTVIVFASLLGTLLLASSIGYYVGGALADKKRDPLVLGALWFGSTISILSINMLKNLVLPVTTTSYAKDALLGSLALFFIPAFFLSASTTYMIRLRLQTLSVVAQTHGKLYGAATLGSLVGVFATGYFLVPSFFVSNIIRALGYLALVGSVLALSLKK